ncbi:MAG: ribosome maturation factor RimM [Lachnospiraceae bacterium]|nr:ribosome maturation factor RimM [Lachnospiraceae bacterium]
MENLLQVGGIANTHGIRGEVKVFPTTDDPKRFCELDKVKLDTGRGYLELEIEHVKFFKQFVILKFKGIDNINDIEKYKGKGLWITREQAVELEEDEYFIMDLIGIPVYNEDMQKIGCMKDVMTTGANDVYIIEKEDGRELLLPAIKECILEVNIQEHYIKVHVMEGLE